MAYLKINSTDYSALLTKYEWVETPRQIDGANTGTAINGDQIFDIIATKYDFSHGCRPLTAASYKSLCDLMELNPVVVEYDSAATNGNRSVTARLTVSAANLVIDGTTNYYNGITLKFTQK